MLKRLPKLLLFLSLFMFLIVSAVSAEPEKDWMDLVTGVDGSGNAITTSVYGYILDSNNKEVFVVCNPVSGKETGQAFVPNKIVGSRVVRKLVRYDYRIGEDWDEVKRVDPVSVRLLAPNIFNKLSYSDYSWDYYNQTGQLIRAAYGPVSWPGSSKGYLVPGSDPDYWLVVAEASNPNPFPVKAKILAKIDKWCNSPGGSGIVLSSEKEVLLGANEKKYVLINRGKKSGYCMIADDNEWSGNRTQTWSEAYFNSTVSENLDPEFPESLKPNKGFISFTNYSGQPPVPNDLSDGFSVWYDVECRENDYPYAWSFKGTVRLTQNGWSVSAGSESKNPTLATQRVKEFFSSRPLDQIPNINDDSVTYDDIRFYRCRSRGANASTGPYKNYYDSPGPAIVDYSAYNVDLNSGNGQYDLVSSHGTELPVLKYYPIFIEFFRFSPDGSTDTGWLKKEVTPGYAIYSSDIDRPYFSVNDRLINYTIENRFVGDWDWGGYNVWTVKINHHVTISAVNPGDEVQVTFENVQLSLPNIYNAVCSMPFDCQVTSPVYQWNKSYKYDPTVYSGSVTLNNNQTKTLYNSDMTTQIEFIDSNPYDGYDGYNLDQAQVANAMSTFLPTHFNWNGEAALVHNNGKITITPDADETKKVLTFNVAQFKYERNGKNYYRDVSVFDTEDGGKWLQPLSYFKGEQFGLRPLDNMWVELLGSRKNSVYIGQGEYYFWPAFVDSGDYLSLYQWHEFDD